MFTGIIEALGTIQKIEKEGSNYHFTVQSSVASSLKIDQSISHNGVCLTVVEQVEDTYVVTAIDETLIRSNLGELKVGDVFNLERAMMANARLDGHMVQGHVDSTGKCIKIQDQDGSWIFTFQYNSPEGHLLVDKGSVCINGVSLTVVNPKAVSDDSGDQTFSVAIIPYTYEHTNFKNIQQCTVVNLEFDVIGKYVAKLFERYRQQA